MCSAEDMPVDVLADAVYIQFQFQLPLPLPLPLHLNKKERTETCAKGNTLNFVHFLPRCSTPSRHESKTTKFALLCETRYKRGARKPHLCSFVEVLAYRGFRVPQEISAEA